MSLKEKLMEDYKQAMKDADAVRKETVNMVRASIKQFEIDNKTEIEDDADIVKIIKKQVKMRTDALEDFAKAKRDDMVDMYNKEIEVLKSYLPPEMTNEELIKAVKKIADDSGISAGIENLGSLMKLCMKELSDKAAGSMISTVVKDYLSGKFD